MMKGIYTIDTDMEFPVRVDVCTESGWVHFESYYTVGMAKTDCARRGIEISRRTKAQFRAAVFCNIRKRQHLIQGSRI